MAMIYTGSSGFTYKGWHNKDFLDYRLPSGQKIQTFYPDGTKQSQALKFYSQQFNIVEINGTFYALQRANIKIC